jgi:hypothetical protein
MLLRRCKVELLSNRQRLQPQLLRPTIPQLLLLLQQQL